MTDPDAHGDVAEEIARRIEAIAEAVVERQYGMQPAFWHQFGDRGRALSVRDVKYHLPYLSAAIAADEPELFASYVAWVRGLFAGLSFPEETTVATFECIRDTLAEVLPAPMGAVATRFVDAGLAEMSKEPRDIASFIADDGHELRPLARMYLDALLRGDRHAASKLVLDSVERGADLADVYLRVLQDVQLEVGRLWFTNQITVAKEHYCTAVTQSVVAQLYPRIMATPKTGKRILVACAPGERHEVGARMVADLCELDGWDAIYLGSDTPASAIADAVREHEPDVLGLSANMTFNLSALRSAIEAARAADQQGKLRVMVGGYQFNAQSGLWKSVGADGFAPDGVAASKHAADLAGGHQPVG
jgi:methanogenic corrinoid protein MtbC1